MDSDTRDTVSIVLHPSSWGNRGWTWSSFNISKSCTMVTRGACLHFNYFISSFGKSFPDQTSDFFSGNKTQRDEKSCEDVKRKKSKQRNYRNELTQHRGYDEFLKERGAFYNITFTWNNLIFDILFISHYLRDLYRIGFFKWRIQLLCRNGFEGKTR